MAIYQSEGFPARDILSLGVLVVARGKVQELLVRRRRSRRRRRHLFQENNTDGIRTHAGRDLLNRSDTMSPQNCRLFHTLLAKAREISPP